MLIIPMRDLKDTVEIEKKCAKENGPIFVTKNGYGRLVVMDIDYYEKVFAKVVEAKLLEEALNDIDNSKTIDGVTAKETIIKKHNL